MTAALVVAVGIAIVWGLVAAWAWSLVDTWTRPDNTIYENVTVTRSGIPVIQSYAVGNYQNISYRTLQGEPIEVGNNDQLTGAHLSEPKRPPRFFSWPLGWGQSLAASDFARPRGGWYLIRSNEPNGRAYFVGYDQFSKMLIGYLSRGGFRRSLPSKDDWFDVGLEVGYSMGAASTQYLQYNSPANQYAGAENDNLPGWLVFVIDGENLQEVNLQQHTVRQIFTAPDLVDVGTMAEASPEPTEDQVAGSRKTISRVAVRTRDRIFVLDPGTDVRREFPLAESLPEKAFTAYAISPEQLVLAWTDNDDFGGRTEHLAWLDTDGNVVREEAFQLAQVRRTNPRVESTKAAGALPIPIGWAIVLGIFAPIAGMNNHEVPTYGAALAKLVDYTWPALIIVAVIGCISAWLVWRWQRKYSRPASSAWCTFALLLGLPGVVAYWLEMRRAKLEPCSECSTTVPRDRDACAVCATPFPAPPPVGTEIRA